ncbi:MAG TPA: hypothetical protein VKN35_07680, partial [Xanthomonadales bacterium]|nr:hypothetical protein [Xanthomonadales bacterium]
MTWNKRQVTLTKNEPISTYTGWMSTQISNIRTPKQEAIGRKPRVLTNLRDPSLYLNRELGQLEFIKRVLAQTTDEQVPLLERLRFLCITSLLVDEFFEVRVASLKQMIQHG